MKIKRSTSRLIKQLTIDKRLKTGRLKTYTIEAQQTFHFTTSTAETPPDSASRTLFYILLFLWGHCTLFNFLVLTSTFGQQKFQGRSEAGVILASSVNKTEAGTYTYTLLGIPRGSRFLLRLLKNPAQPGQMFLCLIFVTVIPLFKVTL